MGTPEIISVVASGVTIVAFLFGVWQHVRLKAAEQAIQSIRNIAQAASIESAELQKLGESEQEKARYRINEAFFVSILNACLAFLRITNRHMLKQDDCAFVHMGKLTQDTDNLTITPSGISDQGLGSDPGINSK